MQAKIRIATKARKWSAECVGTISLSDRDEVSVTIKNPAGQVVCVGMFEHDLLDCGEDGAKVPPSIFESLEGKIGDRIANLKFALDDA